MRRFRFDCRAACRFLGSFVAVLVVLVAASLVATSAALAGPNTWTPPGTWNGGLGALSADKVGMLGSTAFAAGRLANNDGVLFQSTDGGATWPVASYQPLSSYYVHQFLRTRDGVLLCASDGEVSKWDGTSWTRMGADGTNGGALSCWSVARSNDGSLTAAGGADTVYTMATGAADAWRATDNTGLPSNTVSALAITNAHTILAYVPGNGLYRRTSDATVWSPVAIPFTAITNMVVASDGKIYAGGYSHTYVMESSDDGATWHDVPAEVGQTDALVIGDNDDLFQLSCGYVFGSADRGATWALIGSHDQVSGAQSLNVDATGKQLVLGTTSGPYLYSITTPTVTPSILPADPPLMNGWIRGFSRQIRLTQDTPGTLYFTEPDGLWRYTYDSYFTQWPEFGVHTLHYYVTADFVTSPMGDFTYRYDAYAPEGVPQLTAGPSADRLGFVLTSNMHDATSGMYDMRWRVNGGAWSDWTPYAQTARIQVTPNGGVKNVEVEYRDVAGNVRPISLAALLVPQTRFGALKLTPSSPRSTRKLTVSGTLDQQTRGTTKLNFYRKRGSRWVRVKTVSVENAITGSGARFSARLRLARGSYYLQARFVGASNFLAATSGKKTFRVR